MGLGRPPPRAPEEAIAAVTTELRSALRLPRAPKLCACAGPACSSHFSASIWGDGSGCRWEARQNEPSARGIPVQAERIRSPDTERQSAWCQERLTCRRPQSLATSLLGMGPHFGATAPSALSRRTSASSGDIDAASSRRGRRRATVRAYLASTPRVYRGASGFH